MRKYFILILFALASLNLYSQTNVFPENGKVGIGTINPDYPFELNSNKGGGGMFSLLNTTGNEASISYRISNKNINTGWVVGNYQDDYFIYSYTKGSQTVTFKPNGNVGIGITNPIEKLHLEGSLLLDVYNTEGAENGIFFRQGFNNANKYNLSILTYDHQNGGVSPDGLTLAGFDGISFSTGSNDRNERMRIHYNGNVGIGTTTPNAKLEVIGNGINALRLCLSGDINDRTNDSPWYGIGLTNYTSLSLEGIRKTVQLAGYYGLLLKTGGGLFAMHQNGNVGIGTDTPDYKLDVLGTIRAQELKVDMQGADFVFEEDYQLRPIEEVESFVKENKHLPEIAPAKEMQENGVNQSEMNQKLLQKIEELTLYTIEQQK